MKLIEALAYDDVTLIPQYSELTSRSQASPRMKDFSLPIIASCMDTLGYKMKETCVKNYIPFICHRSFKSAKEQLHYFLRGETDDSYSYKPADCDCLWFAVGSVGKYKEWIDELINFGIRHFCVDMAHGDSKSCIDTIKYIRQKIQEQIIKGNDHKIQSKLHIIAGNVATAEGFKRLQEAGANGIRIGIASGSICSTALNTGFGVPILTNIIECAKVRKKDVWIIADGGVKNIGDIAKAVFFGADFCMLGKMLAATSDSEGTCYNAKKEEIKGDPIYPDLIKEDDPIVKSNIVKYKAYRGMASRGARKGILSYASVEGVEGLIKYTRSTEAFLKDTGLQLQASLSYGGSRNWEEFRKKVKACRRSNSGIMAADTHLYITRDA